jgi:hypothetical protein
MAKQEQSKDRLRMIDDSVLLLKNGDKEEKEQATRELLKVFNPLIVSTGQRLAARFPHSLQEVIPVAQSKLIVMIIQFMTPRRDTRGAGKKIGSWAPNICVYLSKNLYYFTMLEISKDIGDKRNRGNIVQYDIDYNIQGPEYNYDFVIEMLDLIEKEYDSKTRDVMMLKYIFGFRYSAIAWITGLTNVQIRSALNRVKAKLKNIELL